MDGNAVNVQDFQFRSYTFCQIILYKMPFRMLVLAIVFFWTIPKTHDHKWEWEQNCFENFWQFMFHDWQTLQSLYNCTNFPIRYTVFHLAFYHL